MLGLTKFSRGWLSDDIIESVSDCFSRSFCFFSKLSTLLSKNSNSFCLIFDFSFSNCEELIVVIGDSVVVVFDDMFFGPFSDVLRLRERLDFVVIVLLVVVVGVGVVVLVVLRNLIVLTFILLFFGLVVVTPLFDSFRLND